MGENYVRDPDALAVQLRAWTREHGPHVRAAVKLPIDHGAWLRRADFTRAWVHCHACEAWIDWSAVHAYIDFSPGASARELAILDLAVAPGESRSGCRSWAGRTPS